MKLNSVHDANYSVQKSLTNDGLIYKDKNFLKVRMAYANECWWN